MNNCKTCKYWSDRYKVQNGVSDCGMIDTHKETGKTTVYIAATATDDSGLDAVLMTGEDFGCVHHVTKKTK